MEEEADETIYWMELAVEADMVRQSKLDDLMSEMNEIVAMTVASIKTLRARNPKSKSKN